MAALQYVDTPGYAALILRRTFPELEQPGNLIPLSRLWFAQSPEAVRPKYNQQDHEWTFPSGAVIRFGHLDNPNAMIRYQGGGYHMLGFDELTHFDEEPYEFIGFSRQRRPPEGPLSQVPMRVRATANPGGPGHLWVMKRFITERKPDVAFIPAKVWDNPGIDADDYVKRLEKLSPVLRQQLLDGDWGAFEGAAFTITEDHIIEDDDFALADSHDRFEACDYGLNGAPWALIPTDYEGNLIFWDMLYVKNALPSDLSEEIVAQRKASWGFGHPAYADPSIWHRTGARNKWGAPAMLADEFSDNGVPLIPANNDPRAGLMRLRELLVLDEDHLFPNWHRKAGQPGSPRLFFTRDRCKGLIEELRTAPLQPIDKRDAGEIISPEWESKHGHACAMARYAVMTKPGASTEPPPPDPTDEQGRRRQFLQEITERENQSVGRKRGRYVSV